jgi:hypothetical protein
VAIATKGSPVPSLNELAIELADFCAKISCEMQVVWVPRVFNEEADAVNQWVVPDNWGIRQKIVQACMTRWGQLTVVRFASRENPVCPTFNSKYCVPQTEAVDCFRQVWTGEFNRVFPTPQ